MGSRDDEQRARTRFTRVIVAVVLVAACLSIAAEAVLVVTVDVVLWQHVLLVAATLLMAGACGVALRGVERRGPERAIEITYAATMLAALVTCLVIEQPQAVIGAAIAFFVLTTAPRILSFARTDRWVTIAIVNALALTGSELLDLPIRINAGPLLRGPIDLTIVVAIIAFAAVAIRELGRFPLRTKLYLVLLLLAISPLALMISAAQGFFEDHDRDDLATHLEARASRAVAGWERFLGDQIDAAHELAREPAIIAACHGDLAAAGARLEVARRAGEPAVQGLGVVVSGQTRARAGVPIVPGAAPISLHALDPTQGALIVLRVPVVGDERCSLEVAMVPGILRAWARATAISGRVGVNVRGPDGRVIATSVGHEEAFAAALALPEGPRGLPLADGPAVVVAEEPGADVVVAARSPLTRWTFTFAAAPDRFPGFALAQLRRGRALTLAIAALAALFAFYLSRRLGAPLGAMTEVLRRFTAGEVDARVVVDSEDEIGALADKINEMAAQVGGLLHSLEEQASRLRSEIAERTEQELRLQALNEELSEARDQALAANRAKSAFLARMSHELRTPLNAIIGYGELLQEVAAEEGLGQIGSDADAITRSARHLLELINDVLDLSKIEAGRMEILVEDFDAAEMLRDVVTVALPLVERQHNQLEVVIDVDPAPMRSDRTKVRQCILNLVSNAAKFTEDGRITLRLRAEELGALPVLVFEVADTGIGIPDHGLEKLFKTFVQVDSPLARKQTGTGLGLAITRRLCRKLGGDIKVRSVVGEGTTFTVRLPQRYHRSTNSTTWGQNDSSSAHLVADESGVH